MHAVMQEEPRSCYVLACAQIDVWLRRMQDRYTHRTCGVHVQELSSVL
jgi:hypothetical protein